jgi:cytochrome P450
MKSIFDMAARGIEAEKHPTGKRVKRETIFKSLTDPALPPEERTFMRVAHETGVILQAGTESISRSLTIAAFYLAYQPALRDQLRDELKTILSTPTSTASWAQLEQLPYLV